MINCPYCQSENADGEVFCEECGRPLKKTKKKKKIQKKYSKTEDGNMVYISDAQVIKQSTLDDVLWFPDMQIYKNGRYEFIFCDRPGESLAEYLASVADGKLRDYIHIERRILQILERVQLEKLVVGSCDLEDFYLIDGEPEKMVLRVVRPLLLMKSIPRDYSVGEFAAPEVKNADAEYIEKRTDVYLAAIIFNRIVIGNRYSMGNIDSQLFWGYNCTNAAFEAEGKRYRRYHYWLGSTLGMFPNSRLKNVKDCRYAFEKCCQLERSELLTNLRINDYLKTDVGKGKKAIMKSAGRQENEWNEDSIEKWERLIGDKKIAAYLLADGISNCDVGTGYLASNIIRDNFKAILEERVDTSFEDMSYDMVEEIVHEIVRRSNRAIWEKACEYSEQCGRIMGSTFVFALIYDGVMYTYSLGDSSLYLVRKGNAIPLNCSDNVGLTALKNGMTYLEYRQMEGKENISLYIGGEYARAESDYYKKREIDVLSLQEEDMIIAASDGVIDYLGSKISDTVWDKEMALVKLLSKKEPLDMKAKHIISRDNKNGGGDNLSIILIQVGGNGNE